MTDDEFKEGVNKELKGVRDEAIKFFYNEVCRRAEQKMLTSHKLEGMHYAAMQEVMKDLELL